MGKPQLIALGFLIIAGFGNGFIVEQNRTNTKSKIEGGRRISIDKVPYQVFVKENEDYICGGVLIMPNIVLTAAHCVKDGLENNNITLSIVAGTDSTEEEEGFEKYPEIIIMHPMYDTQTKERWIKYDIAIIKVDTPFIMSNTISSIKMPTSSIKEGQNLLLTGIGAVGEQSEDTSPYLKAYKPHVVRCENYIENTTFTSFDGIICHRSYKGDRSRPGDSGGPMVDSRGSLVAIHKGSLLCCCQMAVDVFYHLDWIKYMILINTNQIL